MLVSGATLGAVLGYLVGRDWRRIERLQIRWFPVLVVAVATRAIAPFLGGFALAAYALELGVVAIVATVNFRIVGMVLIAIGSLLNMLVVVVNGGMPVDVVGLAAVGGRLTDDGLHVPQSSTTILLPLGDWIVVASLRTAYSIGDFLVAFGAFGVSFTTLARR